MSEEAGPLGDGATRAGKGNMRLVRRAIREGWPITPEMKASLAEQMSKVVAKGRSNRDKAAAARVLVAAEGQNIRRAALALRLEEQTGETVLVEQAEATKSGSVTNVNVQLNVNTLPDERRSKVLAVAASLGHALDSGEVPGCEPPGDPAAITEGK